MGAFGGGGGGGGGVQEAFAFLVIVSLAFSQAYVIRIQLGLSP